LLKQQQIAAICAKAAKVATWHEAKANPKNAAAIITTIPTTATSTTTKHTHRQAHLNTYTHLSKLSVIFYGRKLWETEGQPGRQGKLMAQRCLHMFIYDV